MGIFPFLGTNRHSTRPSSVAKSARSKKLPDHELVGLDYFEALAEKPMLFEGLIAQDSVVMIFGEGGAGKSFTAIDILMSATCMLPWLDHAGNGGGVIYYPSEGRAGLASRFHAWHAEHGVVPDSAPVAFGVCDVNLCDRDEVEHFIKRIENQRKRFKNGLKAIFFDVLAGYIEGADENSNKEMSEMTKNLHKIAQELHVTVFIIHHAGWSTTERERGASAIRTACDTVFSVQKEGEEGVRLKVVRQKDFESGQEWLFDKIKKELPDGKSSLILRLAEDQTPRKGHWLNGDERCLMALVAANDNEIKNKVLKGQFVEAYAAYRGLSQFETRSDAQKAYENGMDKLKKYNQLEQVGQSVKGIGAYFKK